MSLQVLRKSRIKYLVCSPFFLHCFIVFSSCIQYTWYSRLPWMFNDLSVTRFSQPAVHFRQQFMSIKQQIWLWVTIMQSINDINGNENMHFKWKGTWKGLSICLFVLTLS